ncbi:MAG TPA: aldo/keto reductase [Mycobacterium sp.]|nr:aldo/keto reductase [Mycobacterium sp.]
MTLRISATDLRPIGSTNLAVTALGFGSAPLGNRFRELDEDHCRSLVDDAWEHGIRLFDTAPMYGFGLAENRLGTALRNRPRPKYVLSTKVGRMLAPASGAHPVDPMWVNAPPMRIVYDYSYDGALRSIEDSMQRMLTDRIDIALIHDCDRYGHGDNQPVVFEQAMSQAARALFDLRDQGVIGAVGIGVNEADVCVAAAERADFDVFLLAGRYSLLEQDPLDDLMPLCAQRGISLILGGVFNSGILATGVVRGARHNYEGASEEVVARVAAIEKLCAAHNVSIAAVSLQFALAPPEVASVVLGASSLGQQEANVAAAETTIPGALWDALRENGHLHPNAPIPSSW